MRLSLMEEDRDFIIRAPGERDLVVAIFRPGEVLIHTGVQDEGIVTLLFDLRLLGLFGDDDFVAGEGHEAAKDHDRQ